MNNKEELHLMIVWQNARYKENEIVNHLKKSFEVIEKRYISWDSEAFSESLSKFYGQKLPPNSGKIEHCGSGEFLLVTFLDKNPKYGLAETSRGTEYVNINIFAIKELYRQWTGGGHKIHTTNSPEETNHDITLLLGVNYTDYLDLHHKNALSNLKPKSAATGAHGWQDIHEFFYVINACMQYVVMRNFDVLPDKYYAEEHGDIDFLVEDLDAAVFITGAKKVFPEQDRVHYSVKIADEDILVDFRYIGDEYYDKKWQMNMIASRKFIRGIYVPDTQDYVYGLIYHVLIHKRMIAPDYLGKIKHAFKELGKSDYDKYDYNVLYPMLLDYLKNHSYQIVRPKDSSVFFDVKYAIDYKEHKFYDSLKKLQIHHIKPFLISNWKNGSGCFYFQGKQQDDAPVFIKVYGDLGEARIEYNMLHKLYAIDSNFFPEPVAYRCADNEKFIVIRKLKAVELSDYPALKEHAVSIANQIVKIIKILHKGNFIHRDIRPENFLVDSKGKVALIDFQFTLEKTENGFEEIGNVHQNLEAIKELGDIYAKDYFWWDDAYSAIKVLEYISEQTSANLTQQIGALHPLQGTLEFISSEYENFINSQNEELINRKHSQIRIIRLLKRKIYSLAYKITKKPEYKEKKEKYTNKLSS